MDLGLFLSFQVNNESELTGHYQRSLRYAVAADRAGYRYVWVPEHHLVQFLPSPSALIHAAYIGQHVSCQVGTAVVVLPYHQPLQLAGEINQTDQILEGRFELGVARGAYRYEFDKFGLDGAASLPHFIEMLEALRALWRDPTAPASFSGTMVNFEDAYIWPRPYQQPHPPIWLAAQAPAAVEDAAARGYDVLNSLFVWDVERAREVAAAFHRGRERAEGGGAAQRLGMTRYALALDDEADVMPILQTVLDGWRVHIQLHNYTQNADPRGVVTSRPDPNEPTLAQLREMLLIGTPDELVRKVALYRDMGLSVLNLNSTFGAPEDLTLRSIELFAEINEKVATL